MAKTVTRSYDNYDDAQGVVAALESAGLAPSDISLIGHRKEDTNTAEGASLGAGLGGAAGLLAGLGVIAIPGIGPVVAVGWLASTIAGMAAGAAAGGVIGALTSSGVSEDEAHYYAETLRRGGTVVSVQSPDDRVQEVEVIMDQGSPINRDERLASYRNEGWTRYDAREEPHGSGLQAP